MAERHTQADIANLNSAGLYRFDRGLFLQVKGADAKSWIYRFTIDGRSRWMGIGPARDVTLAKTRDKVNELRVNHVGKKIDPVAVKKQAANRAQEAERNAIPFRAKAEEYMDKHGDKWRSRNNQWLFSL